MNIEGLKALNPHIEIRNINSAEFKKYGKIITECDFSDIIRYMEQDTKIPEEGNVYITSVEGMESLKEKNKLEEVFYGEMPIQIGYCNGRNSTLNGLEYHKGSEINVAVTDFVLLLGCLKDIEDNEYEASMVEAFYISKGDVIEIYGTTLHFAPCKVSSEGFKCVVVLPKGTNTPLLIEEKGIGEGQLLFMKNKWLIVHPSRKVLIDKGAYVGILGKNVEIKF